MNNKIIPETRAYIAGFIDGEGCISIAKTRKKRSRSWLYILSLVITHTSVKPLNFIKKYYGGVIFKEKRGRKIWKPLYSLRFGSHDSLRVIKDLKNKKKRKELLKATDIEILKCPHKKTVAINEEGHAGIYCSDCGKQLEKEC